MRITALLAVCCGLLGATAAMAAPNYTESWDFEDGIVGQPHPDWMADPYGSDGSTGSVEASGPFSGTAYPTGNRLYTGDGVDTWHQLQAPTNSFTYTVGAWTDAGHINALTKSGLGFYGPSAGDAWWEGVNGDTDDLIFGMPNLPNPRPGTASDFQWPGGSGRKLNEGTGKNPLDDLNGDTPQFIDAEMMVKYNTPDNPGTIELWWRTLNYDNEFAAAGVWAQMQWRGDSGTQYTDFILDTDAVTGEPYDVTFIKIGGDGAWSQAAFDNISFISVPEPAGLMLLSLGLPLVLRRRKA